MASVEPVVSLTLRLPESLRKRLYAVRGERSLNAEIVERLRRSLWEEERSLAGSDQGAREENRRSVTAKNDDGAGVRELKPSKVAPGPLVASDPASDSSRSARTAMCEHRVRPGAFCKRCDGSLATGAGGSVSAGLAVSSALVASGGALAEREPTGSEKRSTLPASPATDSGASTAPDAVLGVSPRPTIGSVEPGSRSASASPFVPDALKPKVDTTPAEVARSVPGVTTGGELDLRKSQVTPHLKSEQAGRKK